MNDLSVTILGKKVFPNYRPLPKYTGELFGVEYLFQQSGMTFKPDVDEEVDEGFGDSDQELISGFDFNLADADDETVALPMDDSASEDEVSLLHATAACTQLIMVAELLM